MPPVRSTVPNYLFPASTPSSPNAEVMGLQIVDLQACLKVRERLQLHRHDHFEIFWINAGRGHHRNDFRVYPITPGTVCFISPGQMHAWDLSAATTGKTISFKRDFLFLHPEGQRLLFELPFFFPAGCAPILHTPRPARATFDARFTELESEYTSTRLSREAMLRSSLQVLLIEAQRAYASIRQNQIDPRPRASARLTRQFRFLLEEHFASEATAGTYAGWLGITTGHLRDTISAETGETFGALVHERRRLEARRLLAHTTLTVAEIAYRVGFKEPSYFGRSFRRKEGLSPGRFRERFREKSQENL